MKTTLRILFLAAATAIALFFFVGRSPFALTHTCANDYPGADLGAKINAAFAALGGAAGEVQTCAGGNVTAQVIVPLNSTLRLSPGVYVTAISDQFLVKSGASLIGSGWGTIIKEPPGNAWFVAHAYENAINNYSGDAGIRVANLKIEGLAGHAFNSAPAAIALGNCVNCAVSGVWLDKTHSIGLTVGGGASTGKFSDGTIVSNCLLTGVASQGIGIINSKNVTIANNTFRDAGQDGGPGATHIDVEGNGDNGWLENISIIGNVIDQRGRNGQGNGIVYQAGGDSINRTGPALIANNLIRGGQTYADPTITNNLSNGIYLIGARDVLVTGNNIERTGQSGVRADNCKRCTITNNKMLDVAGGGSAGMLLSGAFGCTVAGNIFEATGLGPYNSGIYEVASADYNTIRDNTATPIVLAGASSRQQGNLAPMPPLN